MPIRYPPTVSLARTPTPIERLERLSRRLPVEVFVKRDDLTGCELTGNKVRKLEFLLAEARSRGATVVITCGAAQSNHARATAIAAARLGLQCRLLVRGRPDAANEGNLFLDRLVGAYLWFLTPEEWRQVDARMDEEAARVAKEGGRPYVIPEGGSNALGSLGYARAMEEIAEWSASNGAVFAAIAHATGSGGTTAGLALGRAATGYPARVLGFAICDDEATFRRQIDRILGEARARFAPDVEVSSSDFEIVEGYKGAGYARSRPEEIEFLREVAGEEGLILDPVYTWKAFRGLLEEARRGRFPRGAKVLFVHTGGIFGLLAQRDSLGSAG